MSRVPTEAQSPLVDQHIRDRIGRTALDRTLFVEAGAGSGKTTLLVKRIVSLVLHADVRLASIAAITFTEAAASELQSRIRAEFERVEADALANGDDEQAMRCRQAVDDTDLAAITTLHGFANRILGEFAVAAGLPPRVRVLDEVASQLAHEERWQRFVDRIYDDDRHERLLVTASALNIPIEPRYIDQITMRDVAVEFNQNWDRLGALIERDLGPMSVPSFVAFDAAVRCVESSVGGCVDPDDKLALHLGTILPQMQAVARVTDPIRKLRLLKNTKPWGPGSGGRAAAWGAKQVVDEVKETIKAVAAAMEQVLAPVVDDVMTRLSQLIAGETFDAAQGRRADGGLEFHDLLVLARDMLRTSPRARAALHNRYHHLLLDEFQDTDPIQIELAVLIATSAVDVHDRPWHDLAVDDGRLFFVGDPKQSIYRFRRADIALFLQAQATFAGESGPEKLSTNFRTVAPIVAWVNAMFKSQMGQGVPEAQPRYEPLTASRTPPDPRTAEMHRPVLLGGPHEDPKIRAADLRAVEAADVVGAIRAIEADPDSWQVHDRRVDHWRAARLDDITVLLPTRTSLPFLRAALDDAGLRYRIATGTLVYDTQEISDVLAALRAVDDPTDELSLVAALRSPIYGCSDVDLFTWHDAGGHWDYRRDAPPGIVGDHPVILAFEHLMTLRRDRWFETPSSLLERMVRERKAPLLAFGDRRPIDVWRRLRFLVEQARSFEEADSGDLRAFTQWAALQGGSMARVHEPLLPETDDEAVSIQTIHGAKGLEFPITILSGMTTQLRNNRSGVSVLWPAVGEPSVKMRKGVETRNHEPRADLEAEMDEYEKIRLAYVATTRARDHLLVSCHHKQGFADNSYAGQFWQVFDDDDRRSLTRRFDWREVVGGLTPERPRPAQLGLALDDRDGWIRDRQALLRPFETRRVMSATGLARLASTSDALGASPAPGGALSDGGADDELDAGDDSADEFDDGAIPARRRGRTGSAVGSAVHAVLHIVDLAEPGGLDDHVAQQCELHAIPNRSIVVRRLIEAALASEAVLLAAQHRHHKEVFVTAPIEDRVIEGYVDLLIEAPHGLVVVDYKTDVVRTDADVDAKLAAYELQAAAYAVALEAVTGREVVECRFVFCRAGGAIERMVADLDRAKQRVREAVSHSTSAP